MPLLLVSQTLQRGSGVGVGADLGLDTGAQWFVCLCLRLPDVPEGVR